MKASHLNLGESKSKPANTKLGNGAPKRRKKWYDVFEKCKLKSEEIISTPKQTKARKALACSKNLKPIKKNKSAVNAQSAPKKCKQKTPTKNKRKASKSVNLEKPQVAGSKKLVALHSAEKKTNHKRNVAIEVAKNAGLQIAQRKSNSETVTIQLSEETPKADIPLFDIFKKRISTTSEPKSAANRTEVIICLDCSEKAETSKINKSVVNAQSVHKADPSQKIIMRCSGEMKKCMEKRNVSIEVDADETDLQIARECINETIDASNGNPRKSISETSTIKLAEETPKGNIPLFDIFKRRINTKEKPIPSKVGKPLICDENKETRKISKNAKLTIYKSKALKSKNVKKHQHTKKPSRKIKMLLSGEMKPRMAERNVSIDEEADKTDLQIARERLHVSMVPNFLPCREREFSEIYTFLERKIKDQCGGCMYISGVPGTGKTATVTGVIRSFQKKVSEADLPSFDFLEINGMRLTEPQQAYVNLYKQLKGKTLFWEQARELLEKRFTAPAIATTTVLLVDELDVFCKRRQDVVYNILDWATKSTTCLIVITIANTMDLPERLLKNKVSSRLGLTRLTFQPYTYKQLQEIVTERLIDLDTFNSDAVQLVARKVASISGDARRALDICRRATEIADNDDNKTEMKNSQCVNISHVQQALAEMITSAKVQAIKKCSRLEQLFLQAVAAEVDRSGVEETSLMGVYSQIEAIAPFMGIQIPTPGRALHICSKLGSQRLLICEHSRNDIFQKILLNVSKDDIHYALKAIEIEKQ